MLLVDAIKHLAERERPTPSDTFSFPSGHTTAGVFIWGILLYILVPLVQSPGAVKGSTGTRLPRELQLPALPGSSRTLLWLLAGTTTAAGRVLADRHWVSDTLAGGCLGVLLTYLAVRLSDGVRKWSA